MKHLYTVSAGGMDAVGATEAIPRLANGLLVKERHLEISTQFVALLNEISVLIKAIRDADGGGEA